MGGDLQKMLLPVSTMRWTRGMLFLGTSETVGEFGDLFSTLDRKLSCTSAMKIFTRRRARPGAGGFLRSMRDRMKRARGPLQKRRFP